MIKIRILEENAVATSNTSLSNEESTDNYNNEDGNSDTQTNETKEADHFTKFIDVTRLTGNELKSLQYKLAKEQQHRSMAKLHSLAFTMGHWNGDSNCMIIPITRMTMHIKDTTTTTRTLKHFVH